LEFRRVWLRHIFGNMKVFFDILWFILGMSKKVL
jgi:hypothetical protein